MSGSRHAGVALATLMLAGCAGTAHVATADRFNLDGECVGAWSELPPRNVAVETTKRSEGPLRARAFAELARCVEYPDGSRAPAAQFTLEGLTPPLELQVNLLGGPRGALAAELILLDGEFRPVRRIGYDAFVRRDANRSVSVFVNPEHNAIRFLLITPDRAHVGLHERRVNGSRYTMAIVTPTLIGAYSDGVEQIVEVPMTDVGSLQVLARPYSLTESDKPQLRYIKGRLGRPRCGLATP